jgi:hypothetical protein
VEEEGGYMAKRTVTLKLTGVRPLLCHNPASMLVPKGSVGGSKPPTPEAEAEAGAYRDDQKRLVFPTAGIRNSILSAAQKSRLKMGKYTAVSVLSSSVFPVEEWALILSSGKEEPFTQYKVDIRTVVIKGHGRVVRARPRFESWAIRAPFELDDAVASGIDDAFEKIAAIAGQIVGIGDFRIEKKGLFGSFEAKLEK